MSLQPCKILSLISPNQFAVQNQSNKTTIIGTGVPDFLLKSNPKTPYLDLYLKQLTYIGQDAVYSTKNKLLQINGKDVFEPLIPAEQENPQKLIGTSDTSFQCVVHDFIKVMRNKEIEAILVSIEGNQLNFLYEKESLINLIPACIYIDDFGTQDGNFLKFMQNNWLGKTFKITFKATQILSVPGETTFSHIPILKADIYEKSQQNIDLSNQFYCSLVSAGFAYITDYGKTQMTLNSFQLLYQCQDEAKKAHLGFWKTGELDRRMLNQISSQVIGTVVEIVEANHYIVKSDQKILHIKLDRIFIEGLEAKEFARKLLIGKEVHILQTGENVPSYSIQLLETKKNVEEELIANGWATAKDNHPHISKFRLQQFQQLNQLAKQKKFGQYSDELSWRIDDQTDIKHSKNVNEIVWQTIQRENQSRKQNNQQGFNKSGVNVIEVVIDRILDGNVFHVIMQDFHSIVNFQINGIVKFSDYAHSFPTIIAYDKQRLDYTYSTLMQRQVYLTIEGFHNKENILFGKMYTKKNNKDSDFAIELLKKGFTFLANSSDYYNVYAEAQAYAQKNKIGIWSEPYAEFLQDFTLTSKKTKPKTIKESNIQKEEQKKCQKIIITEIVDCAEFYVRNSPNPQFEQIETQIHDSKLIPLAKPVKKGTLCLALYSEDNKVYRAQVTQVFKNDQFLVKFIDYGNDDQVAYKDLGALPGELAIIPRQARICGLAYLRVPYPAHTFAEEAAQLFRELVWDQELVCHVAYTEKSGVKQFLQLHFVDQIQEDKTSINASLLAMGIARIEDKVLDNPLKQLLHMQHEAQNDGKGLWAHDDNLDNMKLYEDDLTYSQY